MKALRQMGSGFIIGIFSLLLVIGGISLALAETSAPTPPPTPTPFPTTFSVEFASPIPSPTQPLTVSTDTSTPLPIATAVVQATAVCTVPSGWLPITVGANDTLYTIAERYKTTADILDANNCLGNTIPAPGQILYVPPVPTVTVIPCGPPSSWIKAHSVKAGENLYRISLLYRTTVARLQSANCMGSSTIIHIGQLLWVPNVATSTPAITITNTPVPPTSISTNTATVTPDFSTPTSTFIVTSSPVPPTATTAPTQTSTTSP